MISCKFVYRFPAGGASDSLDRVCAVHAVPRVGETIAFIGGSGGLIRSEVKEVAHYISLADSSHEIVVYYGDHPIHGATSVKK